MSDPTQQIVSDPNLDKVTEYFKTKDALRTIRNDVKDLKAQHEDYQELEELNKKVKELRENIKNEETINELKEKEGTLKERMDLLKEMIRIELIEKGQEEVTHDGKKLKLMNILKELKDEKK